ncbi:MAG: hypothetical protein Tsb009_39540 [Planctomycetaceae bacterium]
MNKPADISSPKKRIPLGTLLGRSLRLRCPRCGKGQLFQGYFKMYPACTECNLKYERAPGYFLGSTYINYGVTAVLLTAGYVFSYFILGLEKSTLLWPLAFFAVLFPILFFRFARSLWLGMDCFFDASSFRREEDTPLKSSPETTPGDDEDA